MALNNFMPTSYVGRIQLVPSVGVPVNWPCLHLPFNRTSTWLISPRIEETNSYDVFPKTLICTMDWFLMKNPAIEGNLQSFLGNLMEYFGITVHNSNFTQTVIDLSILAYLWCIFVSSPNQNRRTDIPRSLWLNSRVDFPFIGC